MKKANRSQAKAVQSRVSNKHVHRLEKKKNTSVFPKRWEEEKEDGAKGSHNFPQRCSEFPLAQIAMWGCRGEAEARGKWIFTLHY